ncbi:MULTISPECIES: hypothetical protein [unclassified Streptomyces]|uniref:hypothetical protein n=1 Tax=unclassified Streptomyces TaxID=2593676 RepID=UPI001BE96512|nr:MULTISPECIES: hypothetical protein [unclassified Streptomyces]MBT2408505.1 hypothetical protein [Streptomyces sp. ISL-21]MBT2459672.1 hypothetical protein [Streptomyces sp. ISL-86]MBT2611942.1 hypothetical protein [Streptomyces sp. ISL-87]
MAVGAALTVVGASPASADAYDCRTWYKSSTTAAGTCTNGTGEFRVYTRCDRTWAQDYTVYDPTWRRVGTTSTATCYSGGTAYGAGIQVH